jgi:hypothetical protein
VRRPSIVIIAILLILLLLAGRPSARGGPTAPRSHGKQLLSADQIKLLFLLMDKDKDGKISKDEWMSFMASEFDQLDETRSGKLDAKELSRLTVPSSTFASTGK